MDWLLWVMAYSPRTSLSRVRRRLGSVHLPDTPKRKHPNASAEWVWRGAYPQQRPMSLIQEERRIQRFRRGSGDGMCVRGDVAQHGKPRRWWKRTNWQPARARPGRVGWRIGP